MKNTKTTGIIYRRNSFIFVFLVSSFLFFLLPFLFSCFRFSVFLFFLKNSVLYFGFSFLFSFSKVEK